MKIIISWPKLCMFMSLISEYRCPVAGRPPFHSDLCLVRVEPDFIFGNNFVRPLAIATDDKQCFVGSRCTVSGWGATEVRFQITTVQVVHCLQFLASLHHKGYNTIGSWWWYSGRHSHLLLWWSEFESCWLLHFSVLHCTKRRNKQKEAGNGPTILKRT